MKKSTIICGNTAIDAADNILCKFKRNVASFLPMCRNCGGTLNAFWPLQEKIKHWTKQRLRKAEETIFPGLIGRAVEKNVRRLKKKSMINDQRV